jgi:thioredoxin reductase (NADPH)
MRPVLLTVDDDPQVVQAIKRDLRHQYGKRFRILKAGSGQKALELVKQLKLRDRGIALGRPANASDVWSGITGAVYRHFSRS